MRRCRSRFARWSARKLATADVARGSTRCACATISGRRSARAVGTRGGHHREQDGGKSVGQIARARSRRWCRRDHRNGFVDRSADGRDQVAEREAGSFGRSPGAARERAEVGHECGAAPRGGVGTRAVRGQRSSRRRAGGCVRRDTDASVREMAAWALADAHTSSTVIDALSTALRRDASSKVRASAAWAFGNIGDRRCGRSTAAALSDSSRGVRLRAVWAIGSIPSRRQAPKAVLALLSDKDAEVRQLAAWALFNIQDPDAVPALDDGNASETDRDTQRALIRALASTGEKSVDAIKRADRLEGSGGAGGGDSRARRRRQQRPVAVAVAGAASVSLTARRAVR